MDFNQKLQELRKQKGITQEELAKALFVSRAAVSKWESGRGYPNIDSLKDIAKFFSITVDELLSTNEAITIAEKNTRQREKHFCDLVFGLLDVCIAMLFFLPFFSFKTEGTVQSASLLASTISIHVKILYFVAISLTVIIGIATLALQNCQASIWLKIKRPISLFLGASCVLLFTISLQPYAAVFAFILLAIKVLMLIKKQRHE